MSRSGYSDDYDDYGQLICYRGQVASATRGKRGQRFFRDLLVALDAMPEKRLIRGEVEREGAVCALGALAKHRGLPTEPLQHAVDHECHDDLGAAFDIARQLAAETMYENDERLGRQTPEERWTRMRRWAAEQIVPTEEELGSATREGGK